MQRMIVIPPDTFERWKKIIIEDKKLSGLDQEMKKILYDSKLNTLSKWHHYRQNLFKYLHGKRKHNRRFTESFTNTPSSVDPEITTSGKETRRVKYKNTKMQTSPLEHKSVATQVSRKSKLPRSFQDIPSLEEVFGNTNRFSSLEEEGSNSSNENKLVELDVDDIVREKALEGYPASVKITKERRSMDPNEYRLYELNNGIDVNVPVDKQMVTRGAFRRGNILGDPAQTVLNFPPKKLKNKASTSTPLKSRQNGKGIRIPWKIYK